MTALPGKPLQLPEMLPGTHLYATVCSWRQQERAIQETCPCDR
jgi:hypothetical protein